VTLLLLVNFLSGFAFHFMSVLLVLYATNEFGMSDSEAGVLYGWWAIISSVWAGVMGFFVIDRAGVKITAVCGTTLLCVTRFVVATTQELSTLKLVILGISPLAEGLLAPTCMVGIKKLTEEKDRAMVFSLQYAGHNLAGGIADLIIDIVRQHRPAPGTQLFGVHLTVARSCFFLSEVALLASAFCACALPSSLGPSSRRTTFKEISEDDARPGLLQDLWSLLRSPNLWRVALISTSLTFTKSQWHHMSATMPKYLIREIDQDVP
jgi:dipeptide/tripeptide permease